MIVPTVHGYTFAIEQTITYSRRRELQLDLSEVGFVKLRKALARMERAVREVAALEEAIVSPSS